MATPSIRDMKAAMSAAGVSYADCTEKAELVERYKTAMKNFSARQQAANASARASPPKATSAPRCAPRATPSARTAPAARAPPTAPKQMTVDQMGKKEDGSDGGEVGAEVRRVCSCKDFYEILRVERSCKEDDLKKAYRKIALRLHPDKCRLTGAEDAFKKVSTAFSCLNDSKTRSGYDVHGEDVCRPGGGGFGGSGFRGDVDAEELFRAFCGGGGPIIDKVKLAVQKNPWVLLVALTMLSNVIYLFEALLSNPILLAIPVGLAMMCPPHVKKHFKTVFAQLMMRA